MKLVAALRIAFLVASCVDVGLVCSAVSARRSLRARDILANVDAGSEAEERKKTLAEDLRFWGEVANDTAVNLLHLGQAAGLSNDRLATLQASANQAPTSAAVELGPMAGMLDGMYDDCKKRIIQLNQREATSKQKYAERSKDHDSRLASIEAEFRNHQHVPAAMRANETALKDHIADEENFFMKYWGRVRQRNHKQYHTFLKIQHGLMDKLKTMREAYQQASQVAAPQVAPEVAAALLQHRKLEQQDRQLCIAFVKDSFSELNSRLEELKLWD